MASQSEVIEATVGEVGKRSAYPTLRQLSEAAELVPLLCLRRGTGDGWLSK